MYLCIKSDQIHLNLSWKKSLYWAATLLQNSENILTNQLMIKNVYYGPIKRICMKTRPLDHEDRSCVLQYILAAHTRTHTHTILVIRFIQSVKSIRWVLLAAWGVWQTGRRLNGWPWRQQPCALERSGRARYSEKVRVPLYQLNDGYCSPGVPPPPVCTNVTTPRCWVEEQKWMTTTVRITLWSKEACPVHQQDNFCLPHIQKS